MCAAEGGEEKVSILSMAVLSSSTRNDAAGAPQLPQIHPRALRFAKEQSQSQEELKLSCA